MIYIPLKHLRPGMVLARSIDNDSGQLPLVVAGQPLNLSVINHLKKLEIPGVYVESSLGSDIEITEFIDPKTKREMTAELKNIFSEYVKRTPISSSVIGSMSKLSTNILDYILSKDDYLMNVIEIRDYDTYTYSHSIYVSILCILIGIEMGFPRSMLSDLALSGLMHDIGKLDINLNIINKPSELTEDEFIEIKNHPSLAVKRLKSTSQIPFTVLRAIESHHEKFDGSGYPNHESGDHIPLYGRIIAIADVYDALTSSRPYRRAWQSNEAIEYMMGCSGTHFDYDILQAFLKTVAAFPVGVIVQLSNDSLAVVTKNSAVNTLRPVVRLLTPEDQKGIEVNLSEDRNYYNVTIKGTINDLSQIPDIIPMEPVS